MPGFSPVSKGADIRKILTGEHEIEFPSAELMTVIVTTGESVFLEQTITMALPTGGSIKRAMLLALVTALNDSANAQKIDVTVQGRKGAGAWSDFFSEDDVIGFGAVDGATTSLVAVQDVSAVVDEAGGYGFRLSVNQSTAQSVRYTTQFLLVITYRMSMS